MLCHPTRSIFSSNPGRGFKALGSMRSIWPPYGLLISDTAPFSPARLHANTSRDQACLGHSSDCSSVLLASTSHLQQTPWCCSTWRDFWSLIWTTAVHKSAWCHWGVRFRYKMRNCKGPLAVTTENEDSSRYSDRLRNLPTTIVLTPYHMLPFLQIAHCCNEIHINHLLGLLNELFFMAKI